MFKYIRAVCMILLSFNMAAQQLSAVLVVDGDFVSGPTGSPPTSTDPAFWTGGGDPNTDPNVLPSTDGIVGVTANGSLTIDGGSNLNVNHLDLGQDQGASGTVNVTGAGSTLNVGVHFHIGAHADDASTLDGGNGELTISNGGVVGVGSDIWLGDSATSTGTAVVDGVGSILRTGDDLFVGDDGMGSLTIRNGGLVEAADATRVGDDPGGNGTFLVDGLGSVFRSRDMEIGDGGFGQATVSNGGHLDITDDLQIANDYGGDGSNLTVTGANSLVTVADLLRLGDRERGRLDVLDGARLEGRVIYVGGNSDGIGTMNVRGANSAVTFSSELVVGLFGKGNAVVSDGGSLEGTVVRIGFVEDSEGAITVQGPGSTIVSAGNYEVGVFGTGDLMVEDGGRAEAGGTFFLGLEPGGVGHITVQGAGTTLESTAGSISMGPQGGDGHLRVLDGAQVTAFDGVDIGVEVTSDSSATVSGAGSQLSAASIAPGLFGKGVLNVLDGGQATASNDISLGVSSGGSGVANVRGAGSQISAPALQVGLDGTGTLNMSESGSANSETTNVSVTSTVNMVVSSNNMLTASTSYTNDGTTNFIAGSQLASGSYTPINSPSFTGSGNYVGIGGTTSVLAGVPTFTVGPILTDEGDGIEISLNGGDRVQFGSVTVALNENAGTDGSFTVTDLGVFSVLGDPALLAFSFESSGLNADLLTALSFNVGQQDRDTLKIYQRTTGAGDDAWLAFMPEITDYTKGHFTFTVDQYNGFDFAIVAIPEPSAFLSIGLVATGITCLRRKR